MIKVYNLSTKQYETWQLPSASALLAHSKATCGKQYDRVERELVEGGLPYVLAKD
jgi:hypothetical protein